MSIPNRHAGKMERQLNKYKYKGTDVTVFEMGEIRKKINQINVQGELEAYLETLPVFILRRLEQD